MERTMTEKDNMTKEEVLLAMTVSYLLGKQVYPKEIINAYKLQKRVLADSKNPKYQSLVLGSKE
jgi:hypothetical protein